MPKKTDPAVTSLLEKLDGTFDMLQFRMDAQYRENTRTIESLRDHLNTLKELIAAEPEPTANGHLSKG